MKRRNAGPFISTVLGFLVTESMDEKIEDLVCHDIDSRASSALRMRMDDLYIEPVQFVIDQIVWGDEERKERTSQ